jgi:hypothetical protein
MATKRAKKQTAEAVDKKGNGFLTEGRCSDCSTPQRAAVTESVTT